MDERVHTALLNCAHLCLAVMLMLPLLVSVSATDFTFTAHQKPARQTFTGPVSMSFLEPLEPDLFCLSKIVFRSEAGIYMRMLVGVTDFIKLTKQKMFLPYQPEVSLDLI